MHHFIEVGEYGLALEEIAGALAQAKTPVTDQKRSDMLALTATMKLDHSISAAQADALFASALQCSDAPSPKQVRQAIAAAAVSHRAATTIRSLPARIAEALVSPAPATQPAPPSAGGDMCGSPWIRRPRDRRPS